MNSLEEPFIGSEALAEGLVKKHQLRSGFRAIFPDVYVRSGTELTLSQRTKGAWLWSGRKDVIAGSAAALMHGTKWVPADESVELVSSRTRPPMGITTRRDRLGDGEVQLIQGILVTSPTRTALDLGRLTRGDRGIARLDALGNATRFSADAVLELACRHAGSPGLPRLRDALDFHDPGAESPRETWLRLLLVRAGYPKPRTQIPVLDNYGRARYYLDMGWEDAMVAVEYDGDHHRERTVFGNDIIRAEFVSERGWRRIRVVAGQRPAEILDRVERAWLSGVRSDRRTG